MLKINFSKNRSKSKIRNASQRVDVKTCVIHRVEHSQPIGPVATFYENVARLKFWGCPWKTHFSQYFCTIFYFQIFISQGLKPLFLPFFVASFRVISCFISAVLRCPFVIVRHVIATFLKVQEKRFWCLF